MSYRFISYTCQHLTRLDNTLQRYDILPVYLLHGNGGYNASDGGLPNSRGGSRQAEGFHRDGTQVYQAQAVDCLQGWRVLSYRARRLANVSPDPTHVKFREKLNLPIDLLTSLSATAKTEQSSIDWNPLEGYSARHCCQFYYATVGNKKQQKLTPRTVAYPTGSVHPKRDSAMIVICPVNYQRRFVLYKRPPCRYPRCVNASCTQAVEQGVQLCERHFALSWRERMEAALAEQYSKWTPTAPEVQG